MRSEELNDQTYRMVKFAYSESNGRGASIFYCVFPRNSLGTQYSFLRRQGLSFRKEILLDTIIKLEYFVMILLLPICGRYFIEIIWMLSSCCDNDALKVIHKTQLNLPREIRICIVKANNLK